MSCIKSNYLRTVQNFAMGYKTDSLIVHGDLEIMDASLTLIVLEKNKHQGGTWTILVF